MSKKKTTSANRGGPKTPARKKPGHVERVSKARTAAGARQALLEMLGDEELSLAKLGLQLAEAATERREALSTLGGNLGRSGYILAGLAGEGDQLVRRMARQVLLHRQQVIGELELDTAAEFMLLDAAMDAYLHWLHLTLLLRRAVRAGGGRPGKTEARLAGIAQGHLRTYIESMQTLVRMKRPPVRVLQVKAGENVAIQINEQTRVLEARCAPASAQPPARKWR